MQHLQLLKLPDGTVKALVDGKARGRIVRFLKNSDFFQVAVEIIDEPEILETESAALNRGFRNNNYRLALEDPQ